MDSRKQSKPEIEYRTVEVRANDDGDGFEGHASTWWVVDSYGTAMKPGAFKRTLNARRDRIPLLWQHWPDVPIGKPTELKEDKIGLAFKANVTTDTRAGAEAMALLRDDVPLAMSFGFQTVRSRPVEDDDADKLDFSQADPFYKSKEGRDFVRVIEEVKLWELSLVTFPANEAAAITAVRADMEADALSSLMEALRNGTLDESRRALVAQIVEAWTAPGPPEEETPPAPTAPDKARRDRDIAIALTLAKNRGWLECVA